MIFARFLPKGPRGVRGAGIRFLSIVRPVFVYLWLENRVWGPGLRVGCKRRVLSGAVSGPFGPILPGICAYAAALARRSSGTRGDFSAL